MANYNDTKMVIDAKIRRNGRQAITGDILNSVLTKMLDELGKGGFKFGGVVTPESSFTPGDANTAFIAAVPGVYTDFGGFTLEAGKLGVFTYDGSWHLDTIAVGGGGSAEGAVRFDLVQALTDAQKSVARGNIGAISTSEMTAAILAESQRAQDTEEGLRGNIQAETERAMRAETGLSNNILAEQTRAENAESALSARIDTIIQGRNVRDIVGNYDELLAYDTSTLGDNDIVMVLLDATKSGHTTYYRWKEADSEWEFIGGLAFTYTKTEIDDKFAALHIVLPSIPADAVEYPEEYQELLAQVDTMVRSAGADASFKMPVLVVDGISGNVDVTFVKSNPAHLYLGIFADDMSTLYHITRTISTPRTYTLQIIEKVFITEGQAIAFANDAIADALDEEAHGAIIEAIKAHHDDTKADQVALDEVKLVAEDASRTAETASQGVSEAKSELTELRVKVGELSDLETTDKSSIVNAINEVAQGGGGGGKSGKYGVISQTQKWAGDYSGYTMTNVVRGTIPQANIDMFIAAGAEFNDTNAPIAKTAPWGEEVQHLPGYFYLNGFGDISYNEIMEAYQFTMPSVAQNVFEPMLKSFSFPILRTNFPYYTLRNTLASITPVTSYSFANAVQRVPQVLVLPTGFTYVGIERRMEATSMKRFFGYGGGKYTIAVPMSMSVAQIKSDDGWYLAFTDAFALRHIKLFGLSWSVSFSVSRWLSAESIHYLIANAANATAITITLHADAKARWEASEYFAEDSQTIVTKNITIA